MFTIVKTSFRDPIKNVKVEATSTVIAVAQIGLKGGIFQYTNALKVGRMLLREITKPYKILRKQDLSF